MFLDKKGCHGITAALCGEAMRYREELGFVALSRANLALTWPRRRVIASKTLVFLRIYGFLGATATFA